MLENWKSERFANKQSHLSGVVLNPLSPISTNKFSKLISIYFLTGLVQRICSKITAFSFRWSFYLFSQTFLLIMYWYCWKKINVCHSWDLKKFLDGNVPLGWTLSPYQAYIHTYIHKLYLSSDFSVAYIASISDPN